LPNDQYLLTLDRTNWKFGQTNINILCLAIVQQGVAIPFEATHLTELDRIEMLLALLAITFCWAHLLGEWLHEQKTIPIKSHYRPAIRIFRYGLD